jgi:hypothetical protein
MDTRSRLMKSVGMIVSAILLMALGACSVKEEKTVQQPAPAASAAPTASAPAATTTSKTYSLF